MSNRLGRGVLSFGIASLLPLSAQATPKEDISKLLTNYRGGEKCMIYECDEGKFEYCRKHIKGPTLNRENYLQISVGYRRILDNGSERIVIMNAIGGPGFPFFGGLILNAIYDGLNGSIDGFSDGVVTDKKSNVQMIGMIGKEDSLLWGYLNEGFNNHELKQPTSEDQVFYQEV